MTESLSHICKSERVGGACVSAKGLSAIKSLYM